MRGPGFAVVVLGLALLGGCAGRGPAVRGAGDPGRGAAAIQMAGCGACHEIPGVAGARGRVGPPLDGVASRTLLAGVLPNSADNLIHWIRKPQSVVPGDAMPDEGLSDRQARDIAAYLETLT